MAATNANNKPKLGTTELLALEAAADPILPDEEAEEEAEEEEELEAPFKVLVHLIFSK